MRETISISAKGHAATTFTSVSYSAKVTTKGQTGPAAKELAKTPIEAIKAVLGTLGAEAQIDMSRLRTDFSVSATYHRTGYENEFSGYSAVYTIQFKGTNVAYATTLHDALTSIVGVESPTPKFNIDENIAIHDQAFADAVAKGRRQFEAECKIVGGNPDNYNLTSWSVRETQTSGKFLAMAQSLGADDTITLEPGKATQELLVDLTFRKKKPSAA